MKKTYKVAILIATVLVVWMFSGLFRDKEETKAESEALAPSVGLEQRPLGKVRTRQLVASSQNAEVFLRGRTEAKRIVDVRSETAGRVVKVAVEKGQRVKTGDLLCELAEDDRQVKLAQARANAEKAAIDHEGALKLKEKGLLSDSQIAASKAAMETARAAVKAAELEVAHQQMRAPFDAVVESRPAELGALMERSGICARLLDETTMLVSAQASEKEVMRLSLGQPVSVSLLSGEQVAGQISFLARAADLQTRTYRVEAVLQPGNQSLRDGITAYVRVPLDAVKAHLISPAVLALDDEGRVGVRIVNAKQIVEFHYVDVVRETNEGVWVTGLPDNVELITVGQEYVDTGDKVEVTREESSPASAPLAQGAGAHGKNKP